MPSTVNNAKPVASGPATSGRGSPWRRMKRSTAEEDRSYDTGLIGDPEYDYGWAAVPDRSATGGGGDSFHWSHQWGRLPGVALP